MAEVTKETIRHLAKLCRIACSPEQEESLFHDMKEIINYIEMLKELPCENMSPCNTVAESVEKTPLRDDEVTEILSRDTFFNLVPQSIAGLVRVPPVMKGE
jgi:aspartyl-tRNA(Asn)/glutamyl-tRNA(Gln) amidotransferase subunit C